jgi:DNA-directed RNA polymerase subunit RPC12/RpoP
MFGPHVLCAKCQHVFPADATLDDVVMCPKCSHEGKPARIMKATGFPSLETFTKNWQRAKEESEEKREK